MVTRRTLDWVLNAIVLVTAVALIVTHVRGWTPAEPAEVPRISTYEAGEVIPDWRSIAPAGGRTLLVYISSFCGYSTASMGFYQRLVTEARATDGLKILFASREELPVTTQYLRNHGMESQPLIQLPREFAPKLRPTPVILLIDHAGKVENVWRGRLREDGEQKLLASVFGL